MVQTPTLTALETKLIKVVIAQRCHIKFLDSKFKYSKGFVRQAIEQVKSVTDRSKLANVSLNQVFLEKENKKLKEDLYTKTQEHERDNYVTEKASIRQLTEINDYKHIVKSLKEDNLNL